MALRVLLADESSTIKRVMQLALQEFAVEVKAVPVGLDVLPVTKTFKPDIIFADVLLTKRNGYEICQDLKNDPETRNVPVVLMWSGFMEIDDKKIAVADARLEKPFDADTLRQIVMDLVPKTQNNPVSSFLQFPKMPEFTETPATVVSKSSNNGQGKIPTSAPISFENLQNASPSEDSVYSVQDELTNAGINPIETEESLMTMPEEEFTSVPLKSSLQKDQHEEDGWSQQDLKKFKIQTPEEKGDDDFATKFVIPQEELDMAHIEDDGEFEELHFGEELTEARIAPLAEKIQTKVSSKIISQMTSSESPGASGTDQEMIERVIRQEAREVIESICWKVLPEMAERIVREEINKILRDVEKSV